MATNTYVALDKVTVSSAVAAVSFNSISTAYTDLIIIADIQYDTNGIYTKMTFNGDKTGTTYSFAYITGSGTNPATSGTYSNTPEIGAAYMSSTSQKGAWTANIMNYSNSTTYKTCVNKTAIAGYATQVDLGTWRNTAAISTIELTCSGSGKFAVGSTFSLYGISAIGGTTPKATGGTVTSDATYWYHTFEMSGNFVPNQSLSCDYLVVAGGGGGASDGGGGGGAGGFRTGSSFSVTAQNYPVLVGGGGRGAVAGQNQGVAGSDSIFSSITSTGGGRGSIAQNAGTGGSGGGAGGSFTGGAGNTPSTSPSQGNSGGNGFGGGGIYGSGGGGGAGAAGGTGTTSVAGNGGNGTASSISGTSVTYAGGGGGGAYQSSTFATGGTGGGGNAGANGGNNPGGNGTQNLGGGGGGNHYQTASTVGGNGGSGIVIVRYAK
jgi:hypothetical protein